MGRTSPATRVLSALMVALGLIMLVGTLARGGGPLSGGVVLGILFCALGGLRLYASVERDADG